VTLWEIFSFATIPYAGLSNAEILPHILGGKQLGKPNFCPKVLYNVMQDCWKLNAGDRPEFCKITARLEENLSYQNLPIAEKFEQNLDYQNLSPTAAEKHFELKVDQNE
jgi:hypothetical protein